MSRFIHTVALAAAVVALVTCLWHEWGIMVTLKRVILSYLGFFFLGSVMALAIKAVPILDNSGNSNEPPAKAKTKGKVI